MPSARSATDTKPTTRRCQTSACDRRAGPVASAALAASTAASVALAALLLAALLLAATSTTAPAQDSARAAPNDRLCFRGRPLPTCRRYTITEIGFYRRVAGTRTTFQPSEGSFRYSTYDLGSQLAFNVGGMVNRGPRSALGGTLLLGVGDGGASVGVQGRYRRWLSADGLALDLATGVVGGQLITGTGEASAYGVSSEAALNAADYGAVVLRLDALRGDGRNASALYGGVRLGSKPAWMGTGAVAAGFLFLVWVFSRADT